MAARGENRIVRVKGRNYQDVARNIDWDPGEDRPIGEPVDLTFGVPPVTATMKAFPGTVHPYAGDHIFHSSWVSRDQYGDAPRSTRQTAGVNKWKVERGGFLLENGNWEFWYYPGKG